MSDGSETGSDIDMVDLTSDDNDRPESGHDDATPAPQEVVMMVDGHGEPVLHTIEGPRANDIMDDDPNSDEDEWEDVSDEDVAQTTRNSSARSRRPSCSGGNPGGDDPGDGDPDDGDDDGDNGDSDSSHGGEEDDEDDERFTNMDPDATLDEALAAEDIIVPAWNGTCFQTCQPPWNSLASAYQTWRRLFILKRIDLNRCRAQRRVQVAHLNRRVWALKEAVREFYAANISNIEANQRLLEENQALRGLVPEEGLADFPDPVPLRLEDMEASLPEDIREQLPPDCRMYLRWWRRATANPRKTERVCTHLFSIVQ